MLQRTVAEHLRARQATPNVEQEKRDREFKVLMLEATRSLTVVPVLLRDVVRKKLPFSFSYFFLFAA